MNIKTEYRPQKKSKAKPFIFILVFLVMMTARYVFIKWEDSYNYLRYLEYVLYLSILILYIRLLFPQKKI